MIVLGIAGPAGAGKNTVAEHLQRAYGFAIFGFADAVRKEVQAAFGLPDQSLLTERATKEVPSYMLSGENCSDDDFIDVMIRMGVADGAQANSPRQIMQWFGTEYRRAQNDRYWLDAAEGFIHATQCMYPYPELAPQCFAIYDTRFPNERDWIKEQDGGIWHVRRDGITPVAGHVSETPLPVLPGERELWNNDSVERLYAGIDLLMRTNAQFVRVEPMLPYVEPE